MRGLMASFGELQDKSPVDQWVLQEVDDKRNTQKDVAKVYAEFVLYGRLEDFRRVNDAVIERWSLSGLDRIKRMAWDMAAEQR